MTRSVRHGLLGPLLLGLIGAAFADMKTTSAEAEVKSIEHALKPEPKLLKLFAFSFYFLYLVSDSARTGRRRVEARRGRREARPARRVHRQRGAEPHAAEHHHQAREAPEASVARALHC